MKKLTLLILIIIGSLSTALAQPAMNSMDTRAKFKSLFIYNFTKYTEWPEAYKQGDFVIGVVDDSGLADALEEAAKTKKINSQNVVIKRISNTAELSQCHVLYVSGATASDVEPFIKKANNYKCLVITEATGTITSLAAINFLIVGGRLNFEMNNKLFANKELIVSNSLERLATKVIN